MKIPPFRHFIQLFGLFFYLCINQKKVIYETGFRFRCFLFRFSVRFLPRKGVDTKRLVRACKRQFAGARGRSFGGARAREYISKQLDDAGLDVYHQSFKVGEETYTNVGKTGFANQNKGSDDRITSSCSMFKLTYYFNR